MKWIGQNIYDQVSKFRNTVDFSDTVNFSEDVTFYQPVNNADPQISIGASDAERLQIFASYTGTGSQTIQQAMFVTHTASGTAHDGMFTFIVDGATILDFKDAGINLRAGMGIAINNVDILTNAGTGATTLSNIDALDATTIATFSAATLTALTVDNIGINGDTITASGDLAIVATGNDISVDTDNFVIESSTGQKPFVEIKNTSNDNKGSTLQFTKDKGAAGADADVIGNILFVGDDRAQTQTSFAGIVANVSEADDTDEAGKLALTVANDGTLRNGITMEGSKATATEVDVTIANGAASVTTLAGTLTMGSTAAMTNAGLLSVANQSSITGVGTLSSGNATGIVTDASTSAKGIASFSSDNFAASSGAITIKDGGVDLTAEVTGILPSANMDGDTAHLSGTQTFTGTKTLNSFKGTGATTVTNILDEDAMGSDSATALATQQSIKAYADRPAKQIVLMRAAFKDDIGTAKHYIPLQSELEQTAATHEMNSFVAPFAGKVLKLMYRGSGNFSGATFTFTLEKIKKDGAFATGGNLSTLETITATGPTNNGTDPNMITVNFVGGGGTNVFSAGDNIMIGLQSDTDVTSGSSKHFFTLVTEFDFSGLA